MALLTCGRTVKAQIIYPSDQVTLDNTNIIYILEGKADKEHTHDAGDITTGQLDNAVFDAYGNLEAKDKIGAGANQAARGNHTHDISLLTGMLPVTMYNAYSNLVSLGRIGTSFDQVARGDHSHPSYAQGIFNLGERVNAIELSRGATNIVAGDADSYNHTTRTLMWNTNAVEDTGATYIQAGYEDSYNPTNRSMTWNTSLIGNWYQYEQKDLVWKEIIIEGGSTGWMNSGGEQGDISGWYWDEGEHFAYFESMWDESYTNDGVKTSAVAQASFDLDLLAGTMVTGVEVSYSSARWNNNLVNGSGLVCFVIGNITSDYYSVSLDEYDQNYKTFSFGSDTDLAGLQASDFDGATNIVVQHCYAGEPYYADWIPGWEWDASFLLTNLACNVHYGEPQELTNKYGLDEQGRFVIVNKEGTVGESIRYPLEEIDELKAGGFGDYWQFELNLKAGHWTDFEIKASTNNFDSLCYYYKSWTAQDPTRGDTNAYVWFTDDHSDDVRVWRKKDHDKSISQMLVSTNSVVETVIFQPSHESEIDWASWMFDERLVWSFVRVDDIGFEMNASGTKQRWSPVTGKRGNLFKP
jgi:hypothetical protein